MPRCILTGDIFYQPATWELDFYWAIKKYATKDSWQDFTRRRKSSSSSHRKKCKQMCSLAIFLSGTDVEDNCRGRGRPSKEEKRGRTTAGLSHSGGGNSARRESSMAAASSASTGETAGHFGPGLIKRLHRAYTPRRHVLTCLMSLECWASGGARSAASSPTRQ